MIDYQRLRQLVPPELELILLESVDSTNEYAKKLAREGYDDWLAVIAKEQTRGKGTRGRSFYSPSNEGLYLSYMFRISGSIDRRTPVTPAAAVAVTRAISNCFLLKPKIKWVNDIEINGKKVCGILSEAVSGSRSDSAYIIVGIGINIFNREFLEEIRSIATSIAEHTVDIDLTAFSAKLLTELHTLLSSSPTEYMKEYKDNNSTIGRMVDFVNKGEKLSGRAIDINDRGHLKVQNGVDIYTLVSAETRIY